MADVTPTDEQLDALAESMADDDCFVSRLTALDWRIFARAVLAKWGRADAAALREIKQVLTRNHSPYMTCIHIEAIMKDRP